MKPLETIYWLRLVLGLVAALLCIGYGVATNTISSVMFEFNTLMSGSSLALITYLLSYYAIKYRFQTEVEKPQKLVTTGIGMYFLSWLVFWVLLYTMIAG